jgi:hypothetical protein
MCDQLGPDHWRALEGDEQGPTTKSDSCSAVRERAHSHHSKGKSEARQPSPTDAARPSREPTLDVSEDRHTS